MWTLYTLLWLLYSHAVRHSGLTCWHILCRIVRYIQYNYQILAVDIYYSSSVASCMALQKYDLILYCMVPLLLTAKIPGVLTFLWPDALLGTNSANVARSAYALSSITTPEWERASLPFTSDRICQYPQHEVVWTCWIWGWGWLGQTLSDDIGWWSSEEHLVVMSRSIWRVRAWEDAQFRNKWRKVYGATGRPRFTWIMAIKMVCARGYHSCCNVFLRCGMLVIGFKSFAHFATCSIAVFCVDCSLYGFT